MSKKTYKLRVPKDPPPPEFVSHGYLEATLVPGKIFETEHENFARHLEQRYGLERVTDEETGPAETAEGEEQEPRGKKGGRK